MNIGIKIQVISANVTIIFLLIEKIKGKIQPVIMKRQYTNKNSKALNASDAEKCKELYNVDISSSLHLHFLL